MATNDRRNGGWRNVDLRGVSPLVLMTILLLAGATSTGASSETDESVLVVVNGDPITTADIDGLVMQTHRDAGTESLVTMDLRKFLNKAVNDRLILQEAYAIGLDEEDYVRQHVDGNRAQAAARAYAEATFVMSDSVNEPEVRAYFEKYYWRIGVRQVSVRTEAEAKEVLAAMSAGASMDSLARAVSIDTYRYQGGLHNFKYWADTENLLRDPLEDVSVGDIRGPFPFEEAYSVVRVERIGPVEWDEFATYESSIEAFLLSELRKKEWRQFLDDLREKTPITTDAAILESIETDATKVFSAEFQADSKTPALSIDEDWVVTESKLRKAIAHAAMRDGRAPFEVVRDRGIQKVTDDLVLQHAAYEAGRFDDPEVVEAFQRDLDEALLEAYLEEIVVPQITFKRSEFEDFYREHEDDFRGPDQVQLSMLMLEDGSTAKEIASRLADGADFEFMEKQYGNPHTAASKGDWIGIPLLSESIQEEIEGLEPGQSSQAIETPAGWLVFKLEARRPGPAKSMEEVELQIRQVMFQKKFNEKMNHHLELLKERSQIVYHQERIDAYFEPGS